ncbi:hypothetical protein JTE90_027948 [Oedothorax gibbosus]|uniref:Acetoacetyl-CoA synthetase n=1 Tax=Oedothorax gibbosus TaxID=931172 RepID=A0AAV6VEY7_9ARAC|nr:hypothetical protein JTE90_027948 [Oedothorax gibbosus]
MFGLHNGGADITKKGYVEALASKPIQYWNKRVPNTQLEKFKKIIEKKYDKGFATYWDLHKWSVENYEDFWKELWHFFPVVASKPYEKILHKTGDGFLDNDWFPGARFNFAENLLRVRTNEIALTCVDEFGHEEEVSFAEMFQEVKRYAAAFKKHGLTMGDRVACLMSNRKEALFAMLATTSVGAIWSGPMVFFGSRATANVLIEMEPKFFFALDHMQDMGEQFNLIEKVVYSVPLVKTLQKVIILATKKETLMELPKIPNSVLLEDFLKSGLNPNGTVPDIVFEQLPFDHPVAINFTSGTTGAPKGAVHSAGTFLAVLRDYGMAQNLKHGDTIYTYCPVGWSVWDNPLPSLAIGCRLLLYAGCPEYKEVNMWNMIAKYKVTYACITPTTVDIIINDHTVPDPGANFDSLKFFNIGASPLKRSHYEFVLKYVKKDVYIGYNYGATEVFGSFSGYDLNSPAHMCEMQVPALGVDMHVFDEQGNSVVGQRGELVIKTPTPSFPVFLWKDIGHKKMHETYITKYKGIWCQKDEGWINPKTRGTVVIGRSDDIIKQNGERFGSGDIYFAIEHMTELQDYLCVGQDGWDGDTRAVLFVKMKKGYAFTPEMSAKIANKVKYEVSEEWVPQVILEVPDIPYNLNHKRMENLVKKIVATNRIPEIGNIKNRECLKHFVDIPVLVEYGFKAGA